ncbi:hypothetical protein IW150_006012 [Coemansia sp. RSA 2607]|nr:hypothetical protein IW150_006012 [Coemansia sp. RSA 2607]
MTHSNVIASYRSSLRHSPSTPLIRRRSRSPSSRLSSSVRDFDRPEMHESESSLETAFAVFRMHRAYRLHPTVMDIFCRGAMYVVSSAFDPQTFVQIVSTYRLHNAELTHAEISELVHYLETHETTAAHGRSFRAIQLESPFELLEPLRLVYTESVTAEMELGPAFDRLLPNVKIIRSRFGSYVAPRH